jgi:transketolase
MVTKSELTRVADNIRILSAAMVEKAKSGHPGGAMGGADFMAVLYTEFLRYDPDQMDYPFRDRFFLDPGHMSPMLYSTLALAGTYTVEDLRNLRQWGSVTPGHPEVDVLHGVENTSGPLGQGHAMALGAAIAERFLAARFGEWQSHKTYAYISDGGIEEEVSQGVGRIAGHLGMNNLIMYYDSNNVQLSTKVDEVDTENVAMKYEAWGWNVITIDGHDVEQIREALTAANAEKERPTLIIGRTVMGKGAVAADGSSFEDKVSTHGQPLTAAEPISPLPSVTWAAMQRIRSRSSPRAARCSTPAAKSFVNGCARSARGRRRGVPSTRSSPANSIFSSRVRCRRWTTRDSRSNPTVRPAPPRLRCSPSMRSGSKI